MAETQLDVDELINRMAQKHGVAVAQLTITELKLEVANKRIAELEAQADA